MNIRYEDMHYKGIHYEIVHQCVMCYNKQTTNKTKCAFCGEKYFISTAHFDMPTLELAWDKDVNSTKEWITSVYKQLEDK